MTDGSHATRKSLIAELAILTASLLIITRILFVARANLNIGSLLPVIVAILFLYSPIIVMWRRRRHIDFLDRNLKDYIFSVKALIIAVLIIFPPFLLAASVWQTVVLGSKGFHNAGFPNIWNAIAFQLCLVALPEEFYFRGYFQSAMNRLMRKKWRILGADLGYGWIVTAAVFAVAHSIVVYKWWHFSIFFPALLFGYLRERTGSITAPILFHATSNLMMDWFTRCYF